MADTKISNLTELTSPVGDDILPIVDDPSGSPSTKKISYSNLLGELFNLTDSEIQQMENLDSVTVSNTQWGYLGNMSAQPLEDITGKQVGDLSNVSTSTFAAGQLLIYDATNSYFSNAVLTAGTNISITNADGSVTIDNDIVDHADLANINSDAHHVKYTDEEAQDAINALLKGGTNVTLTYDDANDTLTIDASDTDSRADVSDDGSLVVSDVTDINFGSLISVTDDGDGSVTIAGTDTEKTEEEIEDIVDGLLVAGNAISLTYDDAANTLTVAVDESGISLANLGSHDHSDLTGVNSDNHHSRYTDEEVEDTVDALLQEGSNVGLFYDDAAGTLTISATDTKTNVSDDGVQVVANVGDINFGSLISVTDDGDGTVTITGTNTEKTEEEIEDIVDGLLTGGNAISLTYDDANNILTIDVSESGISLANLGSRQHSDLSDAPSSAHHTKTTQALAGTGLNKSTDTINHDAASVHESGGALEITHNNLTLNSDDHHTKYALTDDLASGEISQIQNIDSVTITNTQWGYLGAMSAQPLEDITSEIIGDLSNVNTGTFSAGELLIYDATNSEFVNAPLTGGTGIAITNADGSVTLDVDSGLDDIAGLTQADGKFIVSDGTNWVGESGATALASLGLVSELANLTTDEVNELLNIGTTGITSTQWGYLGSMSAQPLEVVDAISEIDASIKSGADGTLITGTAGTSGNLVEWNADGDAVDSGHDAQDTATKTVSLKPIAEDSALSTGDNKMKWVVPANLDGMNLVDADAHVFTASSSGTVDVQIHNATDAVDMLSTKITIDASEKDSATAATQPSIDTANDDVAEGDEIRIDVDAAGTDTTGLEVRLSFR